MPTKKQHTVAIGLNIADADGSEVRYERGDLIAAKHVESWMVDDGIVVEGTELPEPTAEPEVILGMPIEDAMPAQAETLADLDDEVLSDAMSDLDADDAGDDESEG